MNPKRLSTASSTTLPSVADRMHTSTEIHLPNTVTDPTSPAATIRQAYKYIIKFNKATTIIHVDNTLISSASWWQLVADIVCIHKLGIVPVLMLDIADLSDTINNTTRYEQIVRLFNRYQQKVYIVYAQYSNHDVLLHANNGSKTPTIHVIFTESGHAPIATAKLFDQLYRGTIPIILMATPTTKDMNTERSAQPHLHDTLPISHSVIENLCATHSISKLICLTEHPFFSQQVQSKEHDNTTIHTTTNNNEPSIGQPEHLVATEITNQWIAQQPSQWRRLLWMIKFATTHNIPRLHIIAYNEQQHDSLLEELFSTKGRGFMVYADEYATIRIPSIQDISALHTFYQPFATHNTLRTQSTEHIRANLQRYYIYELDGEIVAACSCLPLTKQLYELGALATDPALHSEGLATQLLHHVCRAISEQRTVDLASCSMIAITTSAHTWFVQHGFINIELYKLPQLVIERITQRNHNEKRELGSIYYAPINAIV